MTRHTHFITLYAQVVVHGVDYQTAINISRRFSSKIIKISLQICLKFKIFKMDTLIVYAQKLL